MVDEAGEGKTGETWNQQIMAARQKVFEFKSYAHESL